MITRLVRIASVSALSFLPLLAEAQQQGTPAVARITPYAGYIAFGDIANGPLGSRITNQAAPVYGLQLGLDVLPNVALVGNVAYASSRLEAGLPIVGGIGIGDSQVLMYDGGVQLRLPGMLSSGTITPYVQGGVGAIRYAVQVGPVSTTSTNVAANFGGGVDLQLGRSLGVRLMATDYIGKFDFQEAVGIGMSGSLAHNWVMGVGLNLGLR